MAERTASRPPRSPVSASGARGTKGSFSITPVGAVLFHLRSNWLTNHWNIALSYVKRLCSSCESDEGLVQFDDPNTASCCPYNKVLF